MAPRTFAELLRRHRTAAGLTQEALAEKAGLSARGLSDLERGLRRSPHPGTVMRIADALRLDEADRLDLLDAAFAQRSGSEAGNAVLNGGGVRHNLPLQVTSFVGRIQETVDVCRDLANARLVTLAGPGGVGKTRLALRVAEQELQRHGDGVWFVELAPLREPALVAQAVSGVLNVREEPDESVLSTLTKQLEPLQVLLILDNCEHLLSACAELVHSVLRRCPHLSVLITSREPLNLSGESVWRVRGLGVARPTSSVPADVSAVDAVQLFVDRARAVTKDFQLTESNANSVAQICVRLDGNPLAIELAAARTAFLPVLEIATRLDDRFHLLTGGSPAVPERMQTLRATVTWSYDLLEPAEQELFQRLSVFNRSFSLEAAEAVCAGGRIDEQAIPDVLGRLVAKSLLYPERSHELARFRMLETICQFASGLVLPGDRAVLQHNHASYYLALAEQAAPELKRRDQAKWLDLLDDDHDNLRAALARSMDAGETAIAMRLGACLWRYWLYRGHVLEAQEWLRRLLALPGANIPGRMEVLFGAGVIARERGLLQSADAGFDELRQCSAATDDDRLHSSALAQLGSIAYSRGDLTLAERLHTSALEIRQRHGWKWGVVISLSALARLALERGELPSSRQLWEEALALARGFGDTLQIAQCLRGLGSVQLAQGELDLARVSFDQALVLVRRLRNPLGIIHALECLAPVAAAEGRSHAAERLSAGAVTLRNLYGFHVSRDELADDHPAADIAHDGWTYGDWSDVDEIIDEALAG